MLRPDLHALSRVEDQALAADDIGRHKTEAHAAPIEEIEVDELANLCTQWRQVV